MIISNLPVNLDLCKIEVRDHVISRVNVSKFLGIFIDSNLNFNFHVDFLRSRISKQIGILNKLKYFLPSHILRNLYYSLIYPHFIYGVTVWGESGAVNFKKMSALHSRACKLIFNSNDGETLRRNKILNFDSISKYFILSKFFRLISTASDNVILNSINELIPQHNHPTRFSIAHNYNIPLHRLTKSKKSFIFQAISAWNSLPPSLHNHSHVFSFSRELKAYLLLNQA